MGVIKQPGYVQALHVSMGMIEDYPKGIILGQSVVDGGTGMSKTFRDIDLSKRLEVPVFEKTQMGMAIGLSLAGYWPVISVYPRINFLLEAVGMLCNHLDKIPVYSDYEPRVIVRTAIPSRLPIDPGPQHLGYYVTGLRGLLKNVEIVELHSTQGIRDKYKKAFKSPRSTILIEISALYDA